MCVVRRVVPYVFVALLPLSGCARLQWEHARPTRASLLQAPRALIIEGRAYALDAEAWRAADRSLSVRARVTTPAPEGVHATLDIMELWVVRGSEVWVPGPPRALPPGMRAYVEQLVRGGPAWNSGSAVVVVVHLTGPGGWQHFLRAPATLIRTKP